MGGHPEVTHRIVSELETVADDEQLPPLLEYVDTEALESLVAHADDRPHADVTVQFAYAGHTVTVSEGEVESVEEEPMDP